MSIKNSSVIYKLLLAVVLVMLLYGILSAALFLIASRYQLNNTVGADIIQTSNNTEHIVAEYIDGGISDDELSEAVKHLDTAWGGTITIWDDTGRIIYGDLNLKSVYNLELGVVDRDTGAFRKGLHYSQTNYCR